MISTKSFISKGDEEKTNAKRDARYKADDDETAKANKDATEKAEKD